MRRVERDPHRDADGQCRGWARWAHHVSRHPVGVPRRRLTVVLLAARRTRLRPAPRADRREQQPDQLDAAPRLRPVAEGFGPGANGPLVARRRPAGDSGATQRSPRLARVAADPGVAAVAPAVSRADRRRRGHPSRRRPRRRTTRPHELSTGCAATCSRRGRQQPGARARRRPHRRCSDLSDRVSQPPAALHRRRVVGCRSSC